MKAETVEEYLARGGKITRYPSVVEAESVNTINPMGTSVANLLTLAEADLMYGEARSHKKKKIKVKPKIDFSVLPEALRKKYMKDFLDED